MLIVLIAIAFSSCSRDIGFPCVEHAVTPCSEDLTKANIRIKNNSHYDFCNVVVDPYSGKINCGKINQGAETCYRAVSEAYRYGFVQLYINDKEFVIQPIDYVGEVPLVAGKYTYLLDVTDYNSGKITLTLQKD